MTTHTYTRPWLYPEQQAAMFCDARFGVIEASTKSGKTMSAMVWLTEQALKGTAGQNFWWIAPINDQARVVFDRLKLALPHGMFEAHETIARITLPNRTRIWFKGSDEPDRLYGEDVYAAVVDEASRCRREAWTALLTTLSATAGPVRIIGNVKGRKNWAYEIARRAQAGAPNMHYAKLTAADAIRAGIMRPDVVEEARDNMPASVFRELYYAEPSDDDGNPFGIQHIRACLAPLSHAPAVAFGWDLAKSHDWTVGIGLDASGSVCRCERFQKPWKETIASIITVTGTTPALIDSTGVGDTPTEFLQREGDATFEGFKFTSASKQQLMEGLAVAIQQQAIHFPAGPIVQELETFEYEYTRIGVRYGAPSGLHDDCVCALALAVSRWRRISVTSEMSLRMLIAGRRAGGHEEPDEAVGIEDREDRFVAYPGERF